MGYSYKNVTGGVDMDGVITNWEKEGGIFLQIWKQRLPDVEFKGSQHSPEWSIEQNYPLEIQDRIAEIFTKPARDFYLKLAPMDGAIEAVKRLQKKMEIVIVTTPLYEADEHNLTFKELQERDRLWSQVVAEKKEWLRDHFGKDAPPLVPLSDKTLFQGDLLVDDRPGAGKPKRKKPSWIHVLYDDKYLFNKSAKNKYRMNWGNYTKIIPLVIEEIQEKRRIAA
jgi:5'(3')-deoxyribonucleotidase